MAKKKRKSREDISKEDFDLLKPIDITKLGSNEDPCFGKYHDLIAKECRSCGDSEFCSIATAQYLRTKNLELEGTQKFKDVEEAKDNLKSKKELAKDLIKKYKAKGISKTKVMLKVWGETNLNKDDVKQLINNLWT